MIIAFIGLPGYGKTLGMVYSLCKALKANKRVISNVPVVDTVFGSKNISEYRADIGNAITDVTNTVIGIDEASIVLPNYYWDKLPFDTLIRFAQVRKYGLDILYTSQGWNHTVKRLRDLTNYVVRCKNHGFFFSFTYFDPEYFLQKVPKHFEKDYILKTDYIWRWQFDKVFKAYNTMHVVDSSLLGRSKKQNSVDL